MQEGKEVIKLRGSVMVKFLIKDLIKTNINLVFMFILENYCWFCLYLKKKNSDIY